MENVPGPRSFFFFFFVLLLSDVKQSWAGLHSLVVFALNYLSTHPRFLEKESRALPSEKSRHVQSCESFMYFHTC